MAANRITQGDIQRKIKNVTYTRPIGTLTVCYIEMDNGIIVSGESACVDPATFNKEKGEELAYEAAFDKLWFPMGFLLAEDRMRAHIGVDLAAGPDQTVIYKTTIADQQSIRATGLTGAFDPLHTPKEWKDGKP